LSIGDSTPLTAFYAADAPLVFAHRGGCALGPENTMLAFERGMASGADGLELDVHLSKDGVVVVHHDLTLERTTDGSGPVAELTAAELQRLDAGYHHGSDRGYPERGRAGGVPQLCHVLKRFRDTRIIIEMKVDSTAMGIATATEVKRADAVERVCFAGYGARALTAARVLLPQAASSAGHAEVRRALYRSWCRWPVSSPPYGGYQVPERASGHRIVSPRFIRHAHRAGLKVQVWTVDEEDDMRRLLQWGVDGLISNRPGPAVQIRDALARRPTR
jgi:glycerophosphoryl diester phosphodiesterase